MVEIERLKMAVDQRNEGPYGNTKYNTHKNLTPQREMVHFDPGASYSNAPRSTSNDHAPALKTSSSTKRLPSQGLQSIMRPQTARTNY